MIRINLLAPERPTQKKKSAGGGMAAGPPGAFQAYLILVLLAGGAAFACTVAWWYKSSQIRDLDSRIALAEKRQRELQAIKAQVDAFQAKKDTLQKKVDLIERLKAEQKGPVHMLDEVSKALPDLVWLTLLDQKENALRFSGESNNLTSVADFISGLQRSGWFPQVDLVSSQVQPSNLVSFSLSATFRNPEAAAKAEAAAAAAAAAAASAPPAPGAPARAPARR